MPFGIAEEVDVFIQLLFCPNTKACRREAARSVSGLMKNFDATL